MSKDDSRTDELERWAWAAKSIHSSVVIAMEELREDNNPVRAYLALQEAFHLIECYGKPVWDIPTDVVNWEGC